MGRSPLGAGNSEQSHALSRKIKSRIPGDCFNEPVGRDLMDVDCTNKLGGAAMKRTRQGVLLQGTLDLESWPCLDHSNLEKRFLA